ncbi:TetR family transcriptional regulator [Youhaiella tibetensis]|uniref:TetR/AcrR family transcriptional regulator n=1 Tax=Paradevosia tibetensis TaxID=1447062 RepID=A0A5B9DKS3_9HYPH|nr:TetR/AcrR family transcriptional regulator [Youhaiella tibetensis]AKR54771.1 TetR family transcriptional regulator [Devosia sp. H5989]QEE19891.1 TetR/AcrR family transcriptional regulator [Youhaiella tibetensis]GGF28962.1 TetR family transcriptional regulator [Youhaiella tibetensis]
MASSTEVRPPRAADKILDTAWDLFYRIGIRAVGVDEIVKRAGVTKPSLYRSFPSKDELAATYLRQYDADFWARFNNAAAAHPGDPRAQLRAFLEPIAERARKTGSRGCGLTNAIVEYPEHDNPARQVAVSNKVELRRRLVEMAREMGAEEPEVLGDGLHLLLEGAYVTNQMFQPGGPARHLVEAADRLIEASLKTRGAG